MSVAAAGGSDDGNGGGDKKGKWKVPESLPSSIEEEMEEAADEEKVPSSGVENLDALKQTLPTLSKRDVFLAGVEWRSEFMREHTRYFKLREKELKARPTIQKRKIQRKDILTTTSSASSRDRQRRASSMLLMPPPPSFHDHDKDDHDPPPADDDDDSMGLDSKKPNK